MDARSVILIVFAYLMFGILVGSIAHDTHWANGEQAVGIGLFWPLALLLIAVVGFARWAWDIIRGL